MNSITTSGLICIKDNLNIEYVLCKLDYIFNDDDTFKYIFTPYYDVIDLLNSDIFQGLPGLELNFKKKEYIRENIQPVFISERVPSNTREDYYDILASLKMDYMNPIEYLIKTKESYSGDNLYVISYTERETVNLNNIIEKCNSLGIIKIILNNFAKGNKLILNNTEINNSKTFEVLKFIYQKQLNEQIIKQKKGIEKAKSDKIYKGRKAIKIDMLTFYEQIDLVKKGIITNDDAIKNLKISKSTYYRLKNKVSKTR